MPPMEAVAASRDAGTPDVEGLLTPEARAGLPLRRLLQLYLDPGALFKDASRGPASARRSALAYNRRMRWMLLPYIRRWLMIGAVLLLAIEPVQAMSSLPAAAFGLSVGIAAAVSAVTGAVYLLLGRPER